MEIIVNGSVSSVVTSTLEDVLQELGYGGMVVATALNGTFVPQGQRKTVCLVLGDRLEILGPMQGG